MEVKDHDYWQWRQYFPEDLASLTHKPNQRHLNALTAALDGYLYYVQTYDAYFDGRTGITYRSDEVTWLYNRGWVFTAKTVPTMRISRIDITQHGRDYLEAYEYLDESQRERARSED